VFVAGTGSDLKENSRNDI